MANEMTKLTALVAGIALATTAFAAFDDITVEKYPDADAVLVDGLEEITYNPDGTYVSTDTSVVKILTEKGRREESEIELGYSARYGKSEVLRVSVTGADGQEREIDVSKTTKESTDNSSEAENIYDPMHKKVVCTIPGLKVGDVIRYTTRRSVFKSRIKDQFADIAVMEWKSPIVRQTVRVTAPEERPLRRIAVRNPLGNVDYKTEELPGGKTLHTWVATNTPQVFEEPDTPPLYTLVQNVRFSTAADWEEISRWYWDLSQKHLAKANAGITNKVEEIAKSGGPALNAIYKWVAQEIRYMGLTMEDTSPGYAPHDVDITFENRYGVCRDKAALLVAMLRIAGYEAFPVLIHAGAKMDPEVPMPYFNHAIAAVRAPGDPAANKDGFILMDPTNESSADLCPAYLGDKSYLVATPEGEPLHTSPVDPADANALKADSKATLERDGSMVVESVLDFSGLNDNAYRQALLRRKPEERRRLFERVVSSAAAGAELLSFEMWPKDLRETESLLKIKLMYRVNESVLRGESRDELTVPFLTRVLGTVNWALSGNTSLEKRRFPLVLDSTAKTVETVSVDLGGALGGKARLPEPVAFSGPYEYSRAYAVSDGTLLARRTLAVNAVEFSPAEYAALREDIKRVEAADRPRPVFTKNPDAEANVHYRLVESAYHLSSPYSWVATNKVEMEVLTYDGKKSSAELKFAFNPEWKNVELVSAVVSNKNGQVSAAGEREMSLFDCGWAAAAPRYPASKQLVVNLPSVEIGSVITYTTVTTVNGSPAPFYATWMFDVREPTDVLSVGYRDWMGGNFDETVRNPKMLPAEPMQPAGELWRRTRTVSHGNFAEAAERLKAATAVSPVRKGEAIADAAKCDTPAGKIAAVRNWMSRHVRIAGPSLYEVPLAAQQTDPEAVLAERYASRLDYIRTMCALMKGAGLEADVVFAANDALDSEAMRRRHVAERQTSRFAIPLCRVTVKRGWWLWAETETFFVGTENEYTPVGASPYDGSYCLVPESGTIETIREGAFKSAAVNSYSIGVRENGAIDVDYASELYGPGVGSFRKQYIEMLSEDRSRHFQELLGGLSQAASATRDLVTDTEGYPARMSFSAFVPDYATVSGDTITIVLPEIGSRLFQLTGTVRESPLGVGAKSGDGTTVIETVFPVGYTEVEHLPNEFVFSETFATADSRTEAKLRQLKVSTRLDEKGRLVVTVVERSPEHAAGMLPADRFALLKDWSRLASSRANRTIVVRKPQ